MGMGRARAMRGVAMSILGMALSIAVTTRAEAKDGGFDWPENPFAYTLSDDLFVSADEARFEKASRVFVETMGGIPQELASILTYPISDPMTFGTYALGIGALTLADTETTTLYQKTILPLGKKVNLPKPIKGWFFTADGQYIAGALAGTYAYGIAANDERAQVAALLATKAALYSYFTSHVVLKAAFGRLRPVSDLTGPVDPKGVFSKDPFDFFKGNGVRFASHPYGTAMPSFHFTLYFSTARVYSGVYDNYLIPYGVAALLAVNSAEGHNHWVSDMVAGALIGTGIGNMVLKNYENRKRGVNSMVVPIVSSRGAGVGWQVSF